jgi:hypothetical protein
VIVVFGSTNTIVVNLTSGAQYSIPSIESAVDYTTDLSNNLFTCSGNTITQRTILLDPLPSTNNSTNSTGGTSNGTTNGSTTNSSTTNTNSSTLSGETGVLFYLPLEYHPSQSAAYQAINSTLELTA